MSITFRKSTQCFVRHVIKGEKLYLSDSRQGNKANDNIQMEYVFFPIAVTYHPPNSLETCVML